MNQRRKTDGLNLALMTAALSIAIICGGTQTTEAVSCGGPCCEHILVGKK